MAERRLWIMTFKDAQSFQKSRKQLKIPDASYVTWRKFHTEDPPISRHCCTKYSPPGDLPPMICAPLLLLKIISSIIVCILCFKYIEQQQREGGQYHMKSFNSDGTELCWIFCSQMDIFTKKLWKAAAPYMVDSGTHLLTTLCYDHFIIVGNRICFMAVYS